MTITLLTLLLTAQASGPTSTAAPEVEDILGRSDELLYDISSEEPRLSLYGFIDFSYAKTIPKKRSAVTDIIDRDSFAIGSLNLYLDGRLAPEWRSLAEVRMHYAPNGIETFDLKTGAVGTFSTSYVDLNDYTVDTSWGGVELERVWLEYAPYQWLQIKAGIWLTPYGIWNVDHGSPTIIGVRPPSILKQALFPERQTGLQASGVFDFDNYALRYAATVSNGRGSFDGIRDLDGNKAVGGRLALDTTMVGSLSIGASAYYGMRTAGERVLGEVSDPTREIPGVELAISEQHEELSLAADLRFAWEGFVFQSEGMVQQVVFTDVGRTQAEAGLVGQKADFARYGFYSLVGYRTEFVGLMPYAMYEFVDFGAPILIDSVHSFALGLNARPDPSVTLKVQYNRHILQTLSIAGEGKSYFSALELQAAWAF